MNNPVSPVIRFLQNFPGVCQRAAEDIGRGIQVAFSSIEADPLTKDIARLSLGLSAVGVTVAGLCATPLVLDFQDAVKPQNIPGAACMAMASCCTAFVAAISFMDLGQIGKRSRLRSPY